MGPPSAPGWPSRGWARRRSSSSTASRHHAPRWSPGRGSCTTPDTTRCSSIFADRVTAAEARSALGRPRPRDIVEAVQTAGEAFHTDKVAVLGISLGAGAAIVAAADDPRIAAVVADSAWTDQDFQLARLGFIDLGGVRLPLPPLGVAAANPMVGADVTKARPLDVIAG